MGIQKKGGDDASNKRKIFLAEGRSDGLNNTARLVELFG